MAYPLSCAEVEKRAENEGEFEWIWSGLRSACDGGSVRPIVFSSISACAGFYLFLRGRFCCSSRASRRWHDPGGKMKYRVQLKVLVVRFYCRVGNMIEHAPSDL